MANYNPQLMSAETVSLGAKAAASNMATTSSIDTDVSAATGVGPYAAGCRGYWGNPYGPYQVKLGDVSSGKSATGEISYASGSSTNTTLGIEYYNGSDWSASGSSTAGASSKVGFTQKGIGTERFFGQWTYHTYFACMGQRFRRADYYAGRGQTVSIAHPTFKYCTGPYYAKSRWFTDSSKNQTYSIGLSLFNINLTSQSGWEKSMEIAYDFTGKGWVCGSNNQYEGAPRVAGSSVYNSP
jgi:hypothetical protein